MLGLLAPFRKLNDIGRTQEPSDPVGGLGAMAEPMADAVFFEDKTLGMILGNHRVVGAETLDKTAIARAARIGHHDAIIGTLFGATPGQSDSNRHLTFFLRNILNCHFVYLWLTGVVEKICIIYPRPGGSCPGMFGIPGIPGMAPGIWPFLPILPIFFIIVLIC